MNRRFVKSAAGSVIFNDLADQCSACLLAKSEEVKKCPIDGKEARTGTIIDKTGQTFLCSKKHGFVQSSKTFARMFESIHPFLNELENLRSELQTKYSDDFRRMVHNLESHDAHILQEIGNLVPEKDLMHIGKRNLDSISDALSRDRFGSAKAILTILQSAIGIKHEITIYRQLYSIGVFIKMAKHKVHKLFMNSVYKFFQDFTEKDVKLVINESELEVFVDFDSFSVCLHHILENAKKYTCPNSDMSVSFIVDGEFIRADIEMISLKITSHDLEHIYEEHYSGEYARSAGVSGSGYGMSVVAKLLSLNGARINILPNPLKEESVNHEGLTYQRNLIQLRLRSGKYVVPWW